MEASDDTGQLEQEQDSQQESPIPDSPAVVGQTDERVQELTLPVQDESTSDPVAPPAAAAQRQQERQQEREEAQRLHNERTGGGEVQADLHNERTDDPTQNPNNPKKRPPQDESDSQDQT